MNHKRQGIVIGQRSRPEKIAIARSLRHNQTPHEEILWQHLRASKLGGFHFRRQQIIDGYIVDFYCHSAGVAIEVDGIVHESQKEYDLVRDQALSLKHIKVVRFSNDAIEQRLEEVLLTISNECRIRWQQMQEGEEA